MTPETLLPASASTFDCVAFRVFDASLKTFWRNEPEDGGEERFGETNLRVRLKMRS